MRKLFLLGCMAFLVHAAWALEQVTVDRLEQIVASASGKSDGDIAKKIEACELTQRISRTRLAKLDAALPGERSRAALQVVGDLSEFLDLPPEDTVPAAPPDSAEQNRIMNLAAQHAEEVMRAMPNFFATRETTRFESHKRGGWTKIPKPKRTPGGSPSKGAERSVPVLRKGFGSFRKLDTDSVTVLYRDKGETIEAAGSDTKNPAEKKGMEGWGEFGPFLRLVTSDILKGSIRWSHWEQQDTGLMAVLRFDVPRKSSHYTVQYCCVTLPGSALPHQTHDTPAYRGEIAVDPRTGEVARIVLRARPKDIPIEQADVVVDYARVEIGGQSYVCPARSITVSIAAPPERPPRGDIIQPANTFYAPPKTFAINHVLFSDYHVFRGELRIVTGAKDGAHEGEEPTPPVPIPPSPQP